jgi:hypothetical protein
MDYMLSERYYYIIDDLYEEIENYQRGICFLGFLLEDCDDLKEDIHIEIARYEGLIEENLSRIEEIQCKIEESDLTEYDDDDTIVSNAKIYNININIPE